MQSHLAHSFCVLFHPRCHRDSGGRQSADGEATPRTPSNILWCRVSFLRRSLLDLTMAALPVLRPFVIATRASNQALQPTADRRENLRMTTSTLKFVAKLALASGG
jgi:hypothetical protein